MKYLILLLLTLITANADQLDTKSLSKTDRINTLESEINQINLSLVNQADSNAYQLALNYNQHTINEELRSQIKTLQIRLNKLERRSHANSKINP